MAQTPMPQFPQLPVPFMGNPIMNPNSTEAEKFIRENLHKTLIELYKEPSEEMKEHFHKCVDKIVFSDKFLSKLHKKLEIIEEEDEDDEECDHICCFMHKVGELQRKIEDKEKTYKEVEKEFKEEFDLTPEEKRVFCAIVRSDGPLALASMIGMEVEEFTKHLKTLSKKVHG